MNGLDVLKRIKAIDPRIAVILMTGHGSELVAVEAMKAGAYDYLIKPVILSELKLRLEKLVGDEKRDEELTYHRKKVAAEGGLDQLIGRFAADGRRSRPRSGSCSRPRAGWTMPSCPPC